MFSTMKNFTISFRDRDPEKLSEDNMLFWDSHRPIPESLLNNITKLIVLSNNKLEIDLPDTITNLSMDRVTMGPNRLPRQLISLSLNNVSRLDYDFPATLEKIRCRSLAADVQLPKQLKHLTVYGESWLPQQLPQYLEYLHLDYGHVLPFELPRSLLELNCVKLRELPPELPSRLTYLRCGAESITTLLPETLKELCATNLKTITVDLPAGLESINIASCHGFHHIPEGLVEGRYGIMEHIPFFPDSLQRFRCQTLVAPALDREGWDVVTIKNANSETWNNTYTRKKG